MRALKFRSQREGILGKCHCCQPDSGNPTVRDERGACGNTDKENSKRARKAETLKQSSIFLSCSAPYFYPTLSDKVPTSPRSLHSVGEYVNRFERDLATCLGIKRAVVTVNGTAALQVALRLAGVKAGDEVITQPLTFVATANAIAYNNACPIFIDVNRDTLGLCPDALEQFLDQNAEKRGTSAFNKTTGNRIAAMVPMHTFPLWKMQQSPSAPGFQPGIAEPLEKRVF